jgi:hypothetical protein
VKETTPDAGVDRFAIAFTLLDESAVHAKGFAEAVAAAVNSGTGTYLIVPGAPGHSSSSMRINEEMGDAVRRRDKPAMLRRLAELRAKGAAADHHPIILASHAADEAGWEAGFGSDGA